MLAVFIKKHEYVVKFMETEPKNSIFSLFLSIANEQKQNGLVN